MEHPCFEYSYESAISTIGTAIRSHNRDGSYADYREIIVMQLEVLRSQDDLDRARGDADFQPLHHIATSFTWHSNYGFRAAIARPETKGKECRCQAGRPVMEHRIGQFAVFVGDRDASRITAQRSVEQRSERLAHPRFTRYPTPTIRGQ